MIINFFFHKFEIIIQDKLNTSQEQPRQKFDLNISEQLNTSQMTYSIDKCVKLVGYEYDLPDEVILKIQKIITKDNMKYCVNQFNDKYIKFVMEKNRDIERYHMMVFGTLTHHTFKPYELDHDSVNSIRILNSPRRGFQKENLFLIDKFRWKLNFGDMMPCIDVLDGGMIVDLDPIWKKDMVEHMKNNGMKFNKSKRKDQLFNIYIKHKNFIEEEPFVYTYKNIKKINYD